MNQSNGFEAAAQEHRPAVIEARGLTRYFGAKCAVDGLSFRVPRGSVFAFIGRNGAGKTTTIRMLLGLIEPTRGASTILGHDSATLPSEARSRIGYMAEGHPVYGWMRVGDYGRFQKGFYSHWNEKIFATVVDYFAINPRTKAGHLSHGQRAGLHLAMTLAIEPELLMLDDPATGLDPAARRSLLEAMIYFTRSRERTIFFSSHLLDDVERVADYVAVLDYSVLRAACSVETFRDRVRRLSVRFRGRPPRDLPIIPGLLQATRTEDELQLTVVVGDQELAGQRDAKGEKGRSPVPIFTLLKELGGEAIDDQPISLEDALIAYVGRHGKRSLLLDNL
jgi:ABC-2 type transport system ATP-binding protein